MTRYEDLVLPQAKNVDFSYNFTHPLNYICLLEEELLYKVIEKIVANKYNQEGEGKIHTDKLVKLFGFDPSTPGVEKSNLRKLKICLAAAKTNGNDISKKTATTTVASLPRIQRRAFALQKPSKVIQPQANLNRSGNLPTGIPSSAA